jgi:hypothetical protein
MRLSDGHYSSRRMTLESTTPLKIKQSSVEVSNGPIRCCVVKSTLIRAERCSSGLT